MSDWIEVVRYILFFWLFAFSKQFREAHIKEWKDGGWIERSFMLLEAMISLLFAVAAPIYLIYVCFQ